MSLHLVIVEVMHIGRNCKGYKLISQSCDPGISDDGPKNVHDHMCAFKNLIFCIKNVLCICTCNVYCGYGLQCPPELYQLWLCPHHITNVIFYFTTQSL